MKRNDPIIKIEGCEGATIDGINRAELAPLLRKPVKLGPEHSGMHFGLDEILHVAGEQGVLIT